MNLKQTLFLLIILAFSALVLLLGESFLKIGWLAVGAVIVVAFSTEIEWSIFDRYRGILSLWVAFLSWLFISMVFSFNLPLSLQNVAGYLFSALMFVFFLGLKQRFIQQSWILTGIGILCGWLTFISGFFFIFPTTARILPGMNVVFSTFGHNHIAAIMVLVIPAAWWVALTYATVKRWWVMIVPLIATLTLMTSFSRVATAVAIVETLVVVGLYGLQLRSQHRLPRSTRATQRSWWGQLRGYVMNAKMVLLLVGVVALSGLMIIKVGYSLIATSDKKACPTPIFKKELCKPLKDEQRWKYWQASLDAVKEQPWFGYGPGTSYLIMLRYRLNPTVVTTLTHNHFLQTFGETGIIGGSLFIALMGSVWWRAYTVVRRSKQWFTLNQALLVGITGNFAVAFFDIDWSFMATYTLLLILLTHILRSSSQGIENDA